MDTLQIVYKILYNLEHKKKADYMGQLISPTALGVTEDEWLNAIQMLLDEGLIAGVKIRHDILGNTTIDVKNARATLKGVQYLHDNSAMKKIAEVATDIITILKP